QEIENLVNLEQLYVQDNKIKSIPVELSKLTKLRFLWMQRNEIVDAYEFLNEVHKLTELSELFLTENPIQITVDGL
ncbi:MAG: protein phosphatase 1 regulatory subunit 42, partial [Nitrososphaeraceae archaeon]|nr:protein phosphatase 1 regulatory subunit 42 [Nitrososphaeraceae archaeon]